MSKRLLCVTNAWPPMASGVGKYAEALLSGILDAQILIPRVCQTSDLPDRFCPVLRFSGRCGGVAKYRTILQHTEIVLRPTYEIVLQRPAPRLVVATQPLFSGVGAWLAWILFRTPYVVFGCGEEFRGALSRRSLWNWRLWLIRRVLDRADLVICISHNAFSILAKQMGVTPDKLRVIHPGIDVEQLLSSAPRSQPVSDVPTLLMIGRLAQEHKGFDRTIEALPHILKRHPAAQLRIIGPGSQEAFRRLASNCGVEDKVVFLGEVDQRTLLAEIAACHVFLLPGRSLPDAEEGFGVVYLEAALFKKPSIAGKFGGASEAVVDGQTGLLVDGERPLEIASAVNRLLDDPQLARRLGEAGYHRVISDFSAAAAAEKFKDLISKF